MRFSAATTPNLPTTQSKRVFPAARPAAASGQSSSGSRSAENRRRSPRQTRRPFNERASERRKLSRQNEPLGIGAKPDRDRCGGPDRRRVGNRRRRSRRLYARDFAERRSTFETKRAF